MNDGNGVKYVSITTGTMIRGVMVLLAVFLVWILRDLVLVILTSIVIASFVEYAISKIHRFKIGRILRVVILYVISISILATIFYFFIPLLITEVYNLTTFLSSYFPDVGPLNYFKSSAFSGARDIIGNLSNGLSVDTLLSTSKAFFKNLSGGFFQTLSVAFGSIFNVIMIVVISFYLSIQEKGIENFLKIVVPLKYEEYALDIWERTRKKIAYWVKGQVFLSILIGVLTYLILMLIGIKYALLLALIAAIFELVPYGFLIAMVPAIAFTYLSDGINTSLVVAGAYFIIHQFEVYLLAPVIVKKVVGLSPLVMIISILVGYELAGVWGFILSVPVAVFIMELINDAEKKKIFSRQENEK